LDAGTVFLSFAVQQNSLARLQRVSVFLLLSVSELKTSKLNGNAIYSLIFGEICYLLFNHLFYLFSTIFPFPLLHIKELNTEKSLRFAFKFLVFTGMTCRCDSLAFV